METAKSALRPYSPLASLADYSDNYDVYCRKGVLIGSSIAIKKGFAREI
ncbi:MAG TPA: hypothetical protein VHS31_09230 [Tepidisphaeraceae bacterium]|jgi:hypothetical protein|nr:hypothetical protein [Tepidisphaeraceae bacterium]